MSVGKEDVTDRLIGKNVHPLIMQRRVFVGENGQFSHVALMQFYNGVLITPKAENEETLQQLQEYKSYWLFWKKL
ncbi:MAG: hypothetical protein QM757_35635 [Paludibaculum sp.]